MATKTIELHGILEWAKLFEHNRDTGSFDVETDGATTVDIILDDDNLKKMQSEGVRKQPKPDAEGRGTRVKFKRPWKDKFERDWAAGAPDVYGPDGSTWDGETLIGNGSIGVVFVDVYDTSMGKGSRLRAVQVIDPVSYESDGGGGGTPRPRDYTKQAANLEDVPKKAPKKAPSATGEAPF